MKGPICLVKLDAARDVPGQKAHRVRITRVSSAATWETRRLPFAGASNATRGLPCKPSIGSYNSACMPCVPLSRPGTSPWLPHGIHCERHLPGSFEGELRHQPRDRQQRKPKALSSTSTYSLPIMSLQRKHRPACSNAAGPGATFFPRPSRAEVSDLSAQEHRIRIASDKCHRWRSAPIVPCFLCRCVPSVTTG